MEIHAFPRIKQKSISISQEQLLAIVYKVHNITQGHFMLRVIIVTVGGRGCHEAHANELLLTAAQEDILAKWVSIQGRRGIPMTYASVGQCAGVIAGIQVGATWPKRFCKCHPELKMKKTMGLEKARAKALNRFAVYEFFNMLSEVIKEHDILPENLYNMDEKGLQLGISARTTAMIDRNQKTAYSIEDGNRELVTVIETICADGSILHPSVIFQGVRQNSEWGRNNPCNARFVLF
jgi:hypothetical protein